MFLRSQLFNLSKPQISLLDLNLFRVIYCSLLVTIERLVHDAQLREFSTFPYFHPIPLFEAFGIERISPSAFLVCKMLLFAFLLLATLGIFTRWALALSTVGFFFVHGQLLSLTKMPASDYVFHSQNLVVFVLLILTFDSNIHRKSFISNIFLKAEKLKSVRISGHSLKLVILSLGIVYFGSSFRRIVHSGLEWMDGETLQSYLIHAYFSEGIDIALSLSQYPLVCQLLSIVVICFELSFIVFSLFSRLYIFLLLAGLTFHFAIFYIMKIDFLNFHGYAFAAFLFYWPLCLGDRWSTLASKLRKLFVRRHGEMKI